MKPAGAFGPIGVAGPDRIDDPGDLVDALG